MMKIYSVIILGAGASGLMCGAFLDRGLSVAIIDINDKVAKKLKISGGGKCNISNKYMSVDNFDGDFQLIQNAFEVFSRDDLLLWLRQNGVKLLLRKNRYYFCKDSSDEIIDVLKDKTKYANLLLGREILGVKKIDDVFEIQTSKGLLKSKNLVVATGGKSYKTLGASDIGLKIAKDFGIEVKEFEPALVGFTVQKNQFWMKELSGLSCYVDIKVGDKSIKEEMLFAHKGISGPAVLSASLYWKKGSIKVDFLPDNHISELAEGSKKLVSSVIPLPKRLSRAILKAINFEDKECKKLNDKDKQKLQEIHAYEFSPAGNFGFTKAEVSRGGVLSSELNYKSLESKKVKNLYFIGEVVDITGELGGYNFQWAFSSGVMCGKTIAY